MHNLLIPPKQSQLSALQKAIATVSAVVPVPKAHRRSLPENIRELSLQLTEERSKINRPYWSSTKLTAAYLHYFLPWNLYRMQWLLPHLSLSFEVGDSILDLGSGPLTLPIALWCARPDLHSVPLHFVCTDVATQPMEMGRDILQQLQGENGAWSVQLVRGSVESILAKNRPDITCIMAGNILNELTPTRGQSIFDRLVPVADGIARSLQKDGKIVFIEPGTRLGSKVITTIRSLLIERGFFAQAPCPHQGTCPLFQQEEPQRQIKSEGHFTGWCHFICSTESAPQSLQRLTSAARFERQSLALSCLIAKKTTDAMEYSSVMAELDDLESLYAEILEEDGIWQGPEQQVQPDQLIKPERQKQWQEQKYTEKHLSVETEKTLDNAIVPARVISGPIRLPERGTVARYACSELGLLLVEDCDRIPHGGYVQARCFGKDHIDTKSGARIATLAQSSKERKTQVFRAKSNARSRGQVSGQVNTHGNRQIDGQATVQGRAHPRVKETPHSNERGKAREQFRQDSDTTKSRQQRRRKAKPQ